MNKMRFAHFAAFVVACTAAGSVAGAGPAQPADDKDDAAAQFAVALPKTVSIQPEIHGYGRVVDPAPLVSALAEVETARAVLNASAKEEARVRKLHDENSNVSARTLETAEAALRRDRVQLSAAQGRLLAGWGTGVARSFGLQKLLNDLKSGDIALVRIDLMPDADIREAPVGASVGALARDGHLHEVELVGPAPNTDPSLQGAAYFAVWHKPSLPAGTMLRSVLTLPGEARKVLVVPRSAFVRHEGKVFIYVKQANGSFEHRVVTPGRALDGGVVVEVGLKADDQVVVAGAQQLLASETIGTGEIKEDKD